MPNKNTSSLDPSIEKASKYIIETITKVFNKVASLYNVEEEKEDIVEFCNNTHIVTPANSQTHATDIHFGDYDIRLKKFSVPKDLIKYCIIEGIKHKIISLMNPDDIHVLEEDSSIGDIVNDTDSFLKMEIDTIIKGNLSLLKVLSSAKYEKRICKGIIAFSTNREKSILNIASNDLNETISFNEKNKRIIRKMLEIATDDFALCVDRKNKIQGFICLSGFTGVFVKIIGSHHFQIFENNQFIVEYRNDRFFYKKSYNFSDDDIIQIQKVILDNNNIKAIRKFCKDIWSDNSTFHGTILVFTDDDVFVDTMAKHHRAFRSNNSASTPQLNIFNLYTDSTLSTDLATQKGFLKRLCKIDGAVIFDLDGNLLLFGTILDGLSKTKGKRERGSRYNSALTFVNYYSKYYQGKQGKKYLAITMSEDGNEYGESPVDVFS